MKNSYTDAEIDSMVTDVTAQLGALLKSEGASLLQKSDGEPSDGESLQMAAPDASAPPADASASAGPSPEASVAPDASAPAAPEGASPEGDAQPASLDELVQAYSSLSPEELQMHAQALAQVMQGQSQGQSAAPAPDASAQPPAAPLAGEGSQPVQPEAQAAMKSEIAAFGAQLGDLKKSVEQLAGIVTAVVKAKPEVKQEVKTIVVPVAGKAVTGDNALIKTEEAVKPLTKAEVVDKLNKHARDPNLAKSDRDLIRKYYNGVAQLGQLSHLLK